MADLGPVDWPPDPIRTPRLVLRVTRARDRAGVIELNASAEVRRYLGGPQPRAALESDVPPVPGLRSGVFAVESAGQFIGMVLFSRRDPDRPGHVSPSGLELEVGYLILPSVWGSGYGTEAVGAALEWAARCLPDEPVVLCTQAANAASVRLAGKLGFVEVDRFQEFDAEQWFGVRAASTY